MIYNYYGFIWKLFILNDFVVHMCRKILWVLNGNDQYFLRASKVHTNRHIGIKLNCTFSAVEPIRTASHVIENNAEGLCI